MRYLSTTPLILLTLTLPAVLPAPAAQDKKPDPAALDKQRCPKPTEFALVFSNGYAGDLMPQDNAQFDKLLAVIKAGGFNTVHCTYTDARLALCKKHGVKMMIDLLAEEHHVYKSPDKAKAVCEKLRKEPAVWGYNIWNDPFGKSADGRVRDVANVRQWDPTHPAYCGTYRTGGMSKLTNADLLGYYDFHWKRGPQLHFPHLLAFRGWARERDAWYYTWLSATSGQAGKGNFNRSLYSANTGIACGLRGVLWFLATDLMDKKTLAWTEHGHDILKVHKELSPLTAVLAQVGVPDAVYSTPITRTLNNDALPNNQKEAMPPGLEKHGFPKDFWLQPAGGEFVVGVTSAGQGRDYAFVANHNAYAATEVALKSARPGPVSHFDRPAGKWRPLAARDGVIRLPLAAGGGELLRFGE